MAVSTGIESTRGELGFRGRGSTVEVAPAVHHAVDERGRGADRTQPHCSFVEHNGDTIAQPPNRNMMLPVAA